MKLFVTGGSGFVGQHTIPALLAAGHEVSVLARAPDALVRFPWQHAVRIVEGDLQSPDTTWHSNLSGHDVLVHLAWPGLPNYRELFHFERNLPADYAFVKAAVDAGIGRVLVTGTCFEYGLRDGALSEELPSDPRNPYALAKDTLRKFLEAMQAMTPFELLWIRLFYMHGTGQNANSLLAQLDRAIDAGSAHFDMSLGEQLRDYLPVEEVAQILSALAPTRGVQGIINCCSGSAISVRSLVESRVTEREAKIELRRGVYAYSPLEPLAFWGNRARLQTAMATARDQR